MSILDNNLGSINLSRDPFVHFYSLDGELLFNSNDRFWEQTEKFTGIKVWWNGNKTWIKNNLPHREDGPAMIHQKYFYWYLNGEEYFKLKYRDGLTKESFDLIFNLMKLKDIKTTP